MNKKPKIRTEMKKIKSILIAVVLLVSMFAVTDNSFAWPRVEVAAECGPAVIVSPYRVWVRGHYRFDALGFRIWVPGHWRRI